MNAAETKEASQPVYSAAYFNAWVEGVEKASGARVYASKAEMLAEYERQGFIVIRGADAAPPSAWRDWIRATRALLGQLGWPGGRR